MILPTIHLNGTSPEMLQEGYLAAFHAVRDAMQKIRDIEFNARDYYPRGPDAWAEARAEQEARLLKIDEVSKDLLAVVEHCADAIDAKTKRAGS